MKVPHNSHVALVDGERFVVLRNDGQLFEPRLTRIAEPDLEPTNFSAGIRHQDNVGQGSHAADLAELAHGAAAADWLNGQVLSGAITQLTVIADPRTLGEMRRHYHKQLTACLVGELDKAIANEPVGEIEKVLARA